MRSKYSQSGFTLIELLVVIAIVGLISSLILTSVATARVKGRDAKRKADLAQLQKALEIYYNTNNTYPDTSGTWHAATSCGGTYGYMDVGSPVTTEGYIPGLAPTFVSQLPSDPKPSTAACSGYNYRSNRTDYKIISANDTLTNTGGGPETFPLVGQPFYDPARPTTAWMVTNNPSATSTCPSAQNCW